MDLSIVAHLNYMAIAATSLMLFVLGALWYSPLLFSSMWVDELAHHNVHIQQPSTSTLAIKMLVSLTANIIISSAVALFVIATGSTTATSGLMLGIIIALGFVITTIGVIFNWENRSIKLFLIDSGYPILGILAASILLSLWH